MHGIGKYEFGDGTTYEGEYEKGVRNGKGKYTYSQRDSNPQSADPARRAAC